MFIITSSAAVWNFLRNNKPLQPVLNKTSQTETEIISINKPTIFEGIKMVIYKSPYGYEITYPSEWIARVAPKSKDSPNLEEYYIMPEDIPYGPSPLFQITVQNISLDEYFKTQASLDNLSKILLNNINGYRHQLFSLENNFSYVFSVNNRLFHIIYRLSPEHTITSQEALWVLSTFKITK